MKIYKIYAQCVISSKPIQEIGADEAKKLITEAVNDMINNGNIHIQGETDEEITTEFEKLYDKAIEHFEKYNSFECGDFCVCKTDEPRRSNVYGWEDFN